MSEAAVPVVAALLRALEREDSPSWLEAEVLSVLDAISRPVGMWQRSFQRSNGKPSYAQGVEWEAAIIERLRPARRRIAALLGSSDPEVRAMASELLADVPLRAEEDLQQLKQLFDRDTDPLVRACVAEAVVRAATRSGDPVIISDAMDWARPKLRDAEPVVRFRTARALASTEETMVESAREVMEADAAVAQQIVWPSEV